jgi:P2 family phage contractile tail tube protein
MAISIRKLHEANIYLNSVGFAGIASEVTLPEVKPVLKEHAPTCLKGKIELPYGLEKMTLNIKGDFDEAFTIAASDFYHIQQLQIRSTLTSYEDQIGRSVEQSVVAHLRVLFQGHKPGAFKNGEPVEVEYTASVLAYKLEVDGAPLYDINLLSNKHEVTGVNLHDINNKLLGL